MIKGKRIAIFGFGQEGLSCANFLGEDNQITLIDQKRKSQIDKYYFKNLKNNRADLYFGGNFPKNSQFDLVIRSPGVRPDQPQIKKLTKSGALLTSPTQIFFDYCPSPIIGVTGTKGKGTTASLIYKMLKTKYKTVFLAGNIGTPALDILPKVKKDSLVILELSSFQLMDLTKSPNIAVVLMITTEHLDWHKNQAEYIKSKQSIVSSQKKSNLAIINRDFKLSYDFAKKTKAKVYFFSQELKTNGIYEESSYLVSKMNGYEKICRLDQILLPGRHNLQNVMAATAVAKVFQIDNKNITKVLSTFGGLTHRLQYLGQIKGVRFWDDSCSTIPETAIAAIEAIAGRKILILGGSSKGSDFKPLAKKVAGDKWVKVIVLIGVEAKRIKATITKSGQFAIKIIEGAQNMQEIVTQAYKSASWGDNIILSPGCASFDMFRNYQDRGDQFIREFQRLKVK